MTEVWLHWVQKPKTKRPAIRTVGCFNKKLSAPLRLCGGLLLLFLGQSLRSGKPRRLRTAQSVQLGLYLRQSGSRSGLSQDPSSDQTERFGRADPRRILRRAVDLYDLTPADSMGYDLTPLRVYPMTPRTRNLGDNQFFRDCTEWILPVHNNRILLTLYRLFTTSSSPDASM